MHTDIQVVHELCLTLLTSAGAPLNVTYLKKIKPKFYPYYHDVVFRILDSILFVGTQLVAWDILMFIRNADELITIISSIIKNTIVSSRLLFLTFCLNPSISLLLSKWKKFGSWKIIVAFRVCISFEIFLRPKKS